MRKIKLAASLVLLLSSCVTHHKGDVEVTFVNGDKDTLHIEWNNDLDLTGRGCLTTERLGDPCFASNVRTYKILNK